MYSLSAEDYVLLNCTRSIVQKAECQLPSDIVEGVCWHSVYVKASWHRVLSVIAPILLQDARVSETIKDKIKEKLIYLHAEDLRQKLAMKRLTECSKERDIPCLFLKGALLQELVYTANAPRKMNDIDVLLRSSDSSKMHELLLELGYEDVSLKPEDWRYSWHYICRLLVGADLAEGRKDYLKFHSQVDVHQKLSYFVDSEVVRVDVDGLWNRVNTRDDGSEQLSIEDFLCHLIVHTIHSIDFQPGTFILLLDVALVRELLPQSLRYYCERHLCEPSESFLQRVDELEDTLKEVFFDDLPTMELSESTQSFLANVLQPKESFRVSSKMALGMLPFRYKLLFLLGYLIPHKKFYLASAEHRTLCIWYIHYRYLLKRLMRFIKGEG